jgi:transmembrane sensor
MTMSPGMESSIEIEKRATAWLARRDSGNWSPDDERELNAWLEASTAHEVAFIRLEAGWNAALRLKALGAGVPPGTVPPPDAWQIAPAPPQAHRTPEHAQAPHAAEDAEAPSTTKQPKVPDAPEPASRSPLHANLRAYAVAATLIVAILGSLFWHLHTRGPTYHTAIGGIASVPMTDGSKITLNTDSTIRLAITEHEREIRLERGEAFFQVAPDPQRPFVVDAGRQRIIAIGTQFSVRRTDTGDVRVFVTEGRVRIENRSGRVVANDPVPVHAEVRPSEIVLAAGSIAHTVEDAVLVQEGALPRVEDYLSWRAGFLVFREATLAEAVAEFNRYNERKIMIQDPALANVQLSGRFRTTNFGAFVRLLEDGFHIHAEPTADGILLTSSQ